MTIEELQDFCLSLPSAVEEQPWTEPQYQMLETFKVGGKWFCLFNPEEKFINVTCAPDVVVDMKAR